MCRLNIPTRQGCVRRNFKIVKVVRLCDLFVTVLTIPTPHLNDLADVASSLDFMTGFNPEEITESDIS